MTKTIAYITDIHLDESYLAEIGVDARTNWQHILADVKAKGIHSIIFGGDIGEMAANAWFFESLKEYDLQLTLGNHDTFAEVRKHVHKEAWKDKTEGYYSVEDSYFKYVFLDSSNNAISVTQRLWLQAETSTHKPLLLFVHHPFFPVDTPVDRTYPLQNREMLQQILQQRKAPATLFCGHYHMQDEQTIGAIKQYITPAASYQMVKEAAEIQTDNTWFGYRIIHLTENAVLSEVIRFE